MTKHGPAFAQRTSTPDAEALVAFVEAHGFIYAVKRTKPLLDVLAKTGLLKRRKQRYTMKEETS